MHTGRAGQEVSGGHRPTHYGLFLFKCPKILYVHISALHTGWCNYDVFKARSRLLGLVTLASCECCTARWEPELVRIPKVVSLTRRAGSHLRIMAVRVWNFAVSMLVSD